MAEQPGKPGTGDGGIKLPPVHDDKGNGGKDQDSGGGNDDQDIGDDDDDEAIPLMAT